MSDDQTQRARRPDLPRDHPIRAFADFWTNASDSQPTGGADDTFINTGVKNAYAVIDRYISEGYKVANDMGEAYTSGPWLESGRDLQARMVQMSGDLVAAWFDLTESMGNSFMGEAPAPEATPGTPPPAPIVYDVIALQRTRAQATLSPGAERFELGNGTATSANGDTLPFDVHTSADGPVRIALEVSAAQAPGGYTGNIVNARTGEILGTLLIEIG